MRSFSLKLTTEYCDDLHQIFNQFLLFTFPSRINDLYFTSMDCGNGFKELEAKA